MPKNLLKLIFSIGICLGAGVLGSFFTISSIPTWYVTLNKPFFSPPNWVFGPVWTILYILMGYSLYLVWKKKKVPSIFWIQLILNASWSIIFFGMKSPSLALINIAVLWIAIVLTIKSFYKINKLAAYLLYPYLAWVSFASILNYSIWILNKRG
ncbi:TspO protein [Candidatus Daviesbacteria bacterium RIFCSPHIGHO2_02_FULL_36_13]|uniref:TspO protein n=1 Tax=Candidatus Daviesbacteria bacterium RIFCSPHIGHO2_02_FULL_36_13 TaxID=1797768 RepID=A0A1F5JYK7_9BACT|nr:MAG: TspO protein [Candidatus Daviesbacteria bacterium RIFCSPHIGHO2_02_FULL_36_13]OGE44246.1 MAG: TspO protein [Candidatus Daviesbacteria bacterium RIFCSPLOWO2_01_FULL_36_8]